MTTMRYAISCTPGGLLIDGDSGNVIYFATLAEAEAEARRLTLAADDNPRLDGAEFAAVAAPDAPPLQ